MFIKLPSRIINANQIVEVEIQEPNQWNEEETLRVGIVTTATSAEFPYGSDGSDPGFPDPHRITLRGEEAELFLAALPVYEPALEAEER